MTRLQLKSISARLIPALCRYSVVLPSIAGGLLVRTLLDPILNSRAPLMAFLPGVTLSAWFGGFGPGITTALAGLVLGICFFAPHGPWQMLEPAEIARVGMFLFTSCIICYLSGSRMRAMRAAQQSAAALARSEERFRVAQELSPDAFVILDAMRRPQGDYGFQVRYCNPAMARVLGRPVDQLFGVPLEDHFPSLVSETSRMLAGVIETGVPIDHEISLRKPPDGPVEWYRLIAVRLDHGLAMWITTITQRKLAEEAVKSMNTVLARRVAEAVVAAEARAAALRTLASELTTAEQRERRRLAIELHDHLGHLLVACKMRLGMLDTADASADAATVEHLKEMIDQAVAYTRTLVFELSPPVLYELGLDAAIEWLAEHFHERHGLNVDVYTSDAVHPVAVEMPIDLRVIVFAAVRELLFNVVKHAKCPQAVVRTSRVKGDRGGFQVIVEDRGEGFELPRGNAINVDGLGLFNIRERIESVGGTMTVTSAMRHGTRVAIEVPLSEQAPPIRKQQHDRPAMAATGS